MTASIDNPKIGRARRHMSQLWQVPLFMLGVLAFLGVAATAPYRHTPQEQALRETLRALRTGIAENSDADWLVEQAEDALARLPAAPGPAAETHFLAGSAYYRQARTKSAAQAKPIWPLAVEHLQKARELEVPEADVPALRYRLGWSLYHRGGALVEAIELLAKGVDKGAEQPLAGYQLLARANLELPAPNLDEAIAANRHVIELLPADDGDSVARARLVQAELLIRKGLQADAMQELDRMDRGAPVGLRVQAGLMQTKICEEKRWWSKAIPAWQRLLPVAANVEGGRARVDYALGLCFTNLSPPNSDEAMRVWAEAAQLGGPAGQAAAFRLGELRLSLNQQNTPQALADWRRALADVGGAADFSNRYIDLRQVRGMFENALKQFQEQNNPEALQEVAELYRHVSSGAATERTLAYAAEAYAQRLAEKPEVATETRQAQFRRAAAAFVKAADLGSAEERRELLWHAAQCSISGNDFEPALKALHEFVRVEPNETRLAEAWNLQGDLYHARKMSEAARNAYAKCIEYPNTPYAFKARYRLAVEAMEQKQFDRAYAILEQNLHGDSVERDRSAHEHSLYKMASLLMQMKRYPEASIHLEEALVKYPQNRDALYFRSLLGDCCRMLALAEREREAEYEKKVETTGSPQRELLKSNAREAQRKRMAWLKESMQSYQTLVDDVRRRQSPDDNAQMLQRRAQFGIGECQCMAGEFTAALRTFQSVQMQHPKKLESLYAGLWVCKLAEEVQGSAEQTKAARDDGVKSADMMLEDLKALDANDPMFLAPGVIGRDEFVRFAKEARGRLLAGPKVEAPLPGIR